MSLTQSISRGEREQRLRGVIKNALNEKIHRLSLTFRVYYRLSSLRVFFGVTQTNGLAILELFSLVGRNNWSNLS